MEIIDKLTHFSGDGICPDINVLIDIEPEIGLDNISGNEFGHKLDKIEQRGIDYHRKVNEGYRKIALENKERFFVLSYIPGKPLEMQEQIRKEIENCINQHGLNLLKHDFS